MKTFYPQDIEAWHNWLLQNAKSETEIWLVFYKAGSKKTGITYEEAAEEALCFGWIDSLIKHLDDESHARKFTPRKSGSPWSEVNIARARRMIESGRMTEAGMKLFKESETNKSPDGQSRKNQMELWRAELLPMLSEDVRALYLQHSPSHQRQYAGWVMSAKKDETRQKRIEELSAVLLKGEELGLR